MLLLHCDAAGDRFVVVGGVEAGVDAGSGDIDVVENVSVDQLVTITECCAEAAEGQD